MSMNEIGSVSKQQQKKPNIPTEQPTASEQPTDIFGNSYMASNVDLNADESNSLFTATLTPAEGYKRSSDNLETSSTSSLLDVSDRVLPEDLAEKYPDPEDQKAILTLSETELVQARKLMDTSLSVQNIVQIAKIFSPEDIDKIKTKVEELQETSGGKDKVFKMVLTNDKYDRGEYTLRALDYNMTLRTNVLDKDFNIHSIEKVSELKTTDGETYRMQEAYDLKTNTISKVRYDKNNESGRYSPSYEIRSKMKSDGTMESRELTRPSSVGGLYDVEVLDENGTKQTSSTKTDSNGVVTVKRDMVSPDGTRTEYTYKDDPKGNRVMHYKITTADGEVLMNNVKTFTVLDDNTFKSSVNGEMYTIKMEDDMISVVKDSEPDNVTYIDTCDIEGNRDALVSVLKQMSGDQLIALSKTTDKLVGIDNVIESYYSGKDREIHSGDDMFVVLHEEGHAKDYQTFSYMDMSTFETMISQNDDLRKTYNEERAAFVKAFPEAQREHIDYFINTLTHYGGPSGGLKETVAESNALLETPRAHELLGMRTQYLQQYFPKTIAQLNTLLSEDRKRASDIAPFVDFKLPPLKIPEIKIPK